MNSGINKVILMGRVGKDPTVRHTHDGSSVVSMSVATSERWRSQVNGDQKEKTEWHRVVVFSQTFAEFIQKYVKKGDLVYIEGKLSTRSYTPVGEINQKYITEVVIPNFGGVFSIISSKKGEDVSHEKELPSSVIETMGIIKKKTDFFNTQNDLSDLNDDIPF